MRTELSPARCLRPAISRIRFPEVVGGAGVIVVFRAHEPGINFEALRVASKGQARRSAHRLTCSYLASTHTRLNSWIRGSRPAPHARWVARQGATVPRQATKRAGDAAPQRQQASGREQSCVNAVGARTSHLLSRECQHVPDKPPWHCSACANGLARIERHSCAGHWTYYCLEPGPKLADSEDTLMIQGTLVLFCLL